MALYTYKKAPVKTIDPEKIVVVDKDKLEIEIKDTTVADVVSPIDRKIRHYFDRVKPITVIFPIVLIISGLGILYAQLKPFVVHYIEAKFSDKLNQEITPLVPESYELLRAQYISDPGSKYFASLIAAQTPSEETMNVKGTFYLTIDKIKINNAPVTINVDSYNEKAYQDALSKGLAHFRGTSLPGTNSSGNVFIYGHSAAGDYAEKNPKDVVTAFTRLNKLQLGDEITIKYNDKEYKYLVKKIKETTPDDVTILNPTGGGDKLTLMTCSPPGLNSGRLIIVANRV